MRLPLPKVEADYYCAITLLHAAMIAVFFGLGLLFLTHQSDQKWVQATQLGVAVLCGFMLLPFVWRVSQSLPKAFSSAWRSRKTLRPGLPPDMARAKQLLELIPGNIRTSSPDRAICAVYGRLLAEDRSPRCILVALKGCWHGVVLEQNGHILTSSGERFLNPLNDHVQTIRPQSGFKLDGVQMEWGDCQLAFPADHTISCWLDAEEIDDACPSVEPISAPRRI